MFTINRTNDGKPEEITVKLPPTGEESVQVRWPTDKEWCDRTRKLKLVQTQIGRGKSRTRAVNAKEINALLYRSIVLTEPRQLDDDEAIYVIDRLERSEAISVERSAGVFRIELSVPGGVTTHLLRGPRQSQMMELRRAASDVMRAGNAIEHRARLEPAGELYDALSDSPAEGYAAEVPIIHKEAAIEALLAEIDRLMEDEDPEA